ncbi:Protein furry-like protein-like [Aphelenchoides besseyi]|nr:Protein furry-like protein-like [Aphelenchoides besseyi]
MDNVVRSNSTKRLLNADLSRRKSGDISAFGAKNQVESVVVAELPWGSLKVIPNSVIEYGVLPARYSAQTLLVELFNIFERKLNQVCNEDPVERMFNKSLRRNEDPYLDNLLRTLNGVCEVCLPSVLSALKQWYDQQQKVPINENGETPEKAMKRALAASYLYCVVLIEILPQVHFYPNECDHLISQILITSFRQISYRDPQNFGNNYSNSLVVAETFGEVIGVLSQSHFKQVHKLFSTNLDALRKELPFNSITVRKIISLLMAMKFFRIKTNQVSDFEMGVSFLDELGSYYLEVDLKQKDLKHALAGLLVEILLPAAGEIKTEANIPSLIAFVDKLYSPTYELVNKKAHRMAAYPLLTCLLCISQTKFFLNNWVQFLNLTLANLKNKDMKMSRVALESLYRLLWVYTIRINCEGNTATRSRLESICSSLFPKGNRNVIPKDSPIIIFVKIIHFIAYQKLDFAFKEIIFDLLGCNRVSRTVSIYPERMNIGIRALMVITDGLQQKEGPPGMPRSMGPVPPSGTIQRIKKTYITRPLTPDVARSIGLDQYYYPCRKAFDAILRTLDTQVGRNLLLTSSQTRGKEPEDIIVGDVKPKLDLFRTCLAAIPRLLPDPMSHQELIELLTRMCIHVDEELRVTACQTLQNLITECAEWREDIINTHLNFLTNNIQDTFPTLLESTVRFLLQLLCAWKSTVQLEKKNISSPTDQKKPTMYKARGYVTNSQATTCSVADSSHSPDGHTTNGSIGSEIGSPYNRFHAPNATNPTAIAVHNVEGFALMLLCQLRPQAKKMAISMLRECRYLLSLLDIDTSDTPLITVLDEATPYVLKKYIEHVPMTEKQSWNTDFASACDKIPNIEPDAYLLVNADRGNEYMRWDPWACALSGYCEYHLVPSKCPTAVGFAWPALFLRMNHCTQYVDPANPQNENRASLLRSSKSKASASSLCGEALSQDSYLSLWQKYLVMCCSLAPGANTVNNRSISPSVTMDLDVIRSMSSSTRMTRSSSLNSAPLFVKVSNMLRWEHMTDMRDSVVLGVGSTNPMYFEHLLDEFANRNILRETQEKKLESNARRRKRRDLLRLQVLRVVEVGLFRGLLEYGNMVDHQTGQLSPVLLKILDSVRDNVLADSERDISVLTSLRLHFAKTITLLVSTVPADKRRSLLPIEFKNELVSIFFKWCGRAIGTSDRGSEKDVGTYVEQQSVNALCALLCCGPALDQRPDEEYTFRILDALLNSTNQTVSNIFGETLSLILHLNDQNTQLFEWTIATCYTRQNQMAVKAFKALILLFSKREFPCVPCDFVSLFVLGLVYALDADSSIKQSAILLLQVLRKQFLDDALSPCQSGLADSGNLLLSESQDQIHNDLSAFPTNFCLMSRQLSSMYTQLTMPIFSEVCCRLESARPTRQSAMLSILLQWIGHIELVDPYSDLCSTDEPELDNGKGGWGSAEATQLLLNNLVYITAKFSAEHEKEIAALWSCLAASYPANLPVIVHIIFVMVSLSPEFFIPVVKRISGYLLCTCGERFIVLLMQQLNNSGEQFKFNLIRSEIPPFYKWQQTQSDVDDEAASPRNVENSEQPGKALQMVNQMYSKPNAENEELHKNKLNANSSLDDKTTPLSQFSEVDEMLSVRQPKQLPMPAYGGHYANLSSFLPPSTQPVAYFSRSNLALFLLSELVGADTDAPINWEAYASALLNVSLTSMDSSRSLVCRSARLTILSLCLHFAPKDVNIGQVASLLLSKQVASQHNEFLERFEERFSSKLQNGNEYKQTSSSLAELSDLHTMDFTTKQAEYKKQLFFSDDLFSSNTELLMALCYCLTDMIDRPLWANEEVSARTWRIESGDQLGCFVRHLNEYFTHSISGLASKWTDVAMKTALTTSNRHIAGRCFQICSALCQNLSPFINQLLSRLVEVIGELSDDAQCYMTHMMLCLHAAVPQMVKKSSSELESPANQMQASHIRSISYTPALLQTPANSTANTNISPLKKDTRYSLLLEHSSQPDVPPLNRCRSAATINLDSLVLTDDSVNALSQLIAVCACLLESQVDNEFLLSIHLLNRILECCGKEREQCVHHFDNTIKQLEWSGYNGIVPLAAKGVIYSYGCENAVSVLRQLIDQLNYTTIGSFSSFPLIVIAVLPYFLHTFDSLSTVGVETAKNIANMMNQYREGTFPRDKFQWAKCVVNYLIDAFSPNAMHLVVFASEVLERSTSSMHVYLLHIIYLLISHGDLNDASPVPLNAQVIRVVTKHIQSVNWKEAARILKCIMTQWNRISVSQIADGEACLDQRKPDFDLFVEKALTDSTSPQSPRKLTAQPSTGNGDSLRRQTNNSQNRVREKLISLLTASGMPVIFSQSSSDVHHDGILASTSNMQTAASNSAFSSSEVVSHQDDLEAMSGSSLANAGNESITTDSFPRVFKEFDFLEAEHDSVSESNESCFNWLSTMRPSGMNNLDTEEQDIDEINDPDDEYLIQNEDELDDDVDLSANSSADQSMHIRSFVGRRRALNLRSRPNRPLSRTSDSNDISSDRTPMQSEKHSDDSIPSCSSASEDEADEVQKKTSQAPKFYTSSTAIITSPIESSSTTSLQINDEMPFNAMETTSSIHCRSEVSSQNRVATSARRYPLYLECSHHLSGLIENAWLNYVQEVENDQDGEATSHSIAMFSQLFRESCVKLSGLLRDASHMMASSQTPERSRRDISPYFTHALHVVLKFTDSNEHIFQLRYANLLQRQKFMVYLLRQHFETFLERKEQCIRTLNAMKSTLKLQNLGSLHGNTSIVNQKLFFQLLQLLDKLNEILSFVQETPNAQEFNLSPAVTRLQEELHCCISEIPPSESRLSASTLNVGVSEQQVDMLILHLTNKNYKNALITLRQLRSQFGNEFGCCEHMDVEVLLMQYCRSHKLRTWAMIGPTDLLRNGCDQLKETNMQFTSLVRTLVADASTTVSTPTVRSSRVSSVNESNFNPLHSN